MPADPTLVRTSKCAFCGEPTVAIHRTCPACVTAQAAAVTVDLSDPTLHHRLDVISRPSGAEVA